VTMWRGAVATSPVRVMLSVMKSSIEMSAG
jgi:hypothetical protein